MRKDKTIILSTVMLFTMLFGITSFADMKYVVDNTGTYLEIDGNRHKMTRKDLGHGLGDNIYVQGKEFKAPGWLWAGGNCYYFAHTILQQPLNADDPKIYKIDSAIMLKDCITPDGYRVDAEGRWVDENGNVMHNDFGHVRLGMQDKYRGKSDDEIWALMRDRMIELFSTIHPTRNMYGAMNTACDAYKDSVYGNMTTYGPEMMLRHNGWNDDMTAREYIRLAIPAGRWHNEIYDKNGEPNQEMAHFAESSAIVEKMIKIVIGDNAGQELFDYIRSETESGKHARKSYESVRDSEGRMVYEYILYKTDGTAWETTKEYCDKYANWEDISGAPMLKARPELNEEPGLNERDYIECRNVMNKVVKTSGIPLHKMDFSGFQNRETDYGKRYSVVDGAIIIH